MNISKIGWKVFRTTYKKLWWKNKEEGLNMDPSLGHKILLLVSLKHCHWQRKEWIMNSWTSYSTTNFHTFKFKESVRMWFYFRYAIFLLPHCECSVEKQDSLICPFVKATMSRVFKAWYISAQLLVHILQWWRGWNSWWHTEWKTHGLIESNKISLSY